MKSMRGRFGNSARTAICALAASIMLVPSVEACTGITLTAKNGTVVRGRTMEFGVDIESNVILVPRGLKRHGTAPGGGEGKTWTSKYASVGANALDMPVIIDGINEKGLSAGVFYFMNYAGYQPYTEKDAPDTIAPWEVGSYILDNFATVAEVRAGIRDIVVPSVIFGPWKMELPLHYVVTDPTGATLVIEYVDGKLNLHDNPIGIFTNQPTFDWHLTNLNNYVNLGFWNVEKKKIGGYEVPGLGEGTGLLGLPGDFTPPSRFVRATVFASGEFESEDGPGTVFELFHILNNFDIPRGVVRTGHEKDEHGNVSVDYTQWTSANDTENKTFYFRTYDDSAIRKIDLKDQDLDATEVKTWSMQGQEHFIELGAPQ